ncbi:MAG TPA: tetratricopeptide repeat protein [bacterium]|nr:tetratricopeptide repeat protein [bacterium]
MIFPVPEKFTRLVDQIDGWLELRCPERAIELLPPLLNAPEARACGLSLRIRALLRMAQYDAAIVDLGELRKLHPQDDWVDLTEAWCRRRRGDLDGAIRCVEQLLARNHRHDVAHFNLACYLALTNQKDRAIDELSLACGLNPDCRAYAVDEPDFDGLRTDERFRQLLRREST